MTDTKTPYYITTAISYPNGKPHIGHAYEAIAADAIARFQRLSGREVRFQTGTDEHGLKMVQTARDKGVDVRELCRDMSDQFQAMCDKLNVSYDRFIRTTEPAHHAACQELWKRLDAAGDIELGRYEGWYSVRDEAFYEEKELTTCADGLKLSPQGTPVEWTVEENFRFKLSAYTDKLLAYYEAHPDFVQPESRFNEVKRFVEGGLNDLSISRTSFDWGVKVPGHPEHVMYVWLDALTNYLTGLGYPGEIGEMWPASLHLIGKDVVRFHAVYWPAFLMSAGLPLPRQIFGHGFLLARSGEKMSKSLGNVVDPMELAERFGVDALRYFLLREVSFGQDGTFSAEAIVTRCNAELANSFGNLAQRVLSMIAKNLDGVLPEAAQEQIYEDKVSAIERILAPFIKLKIENLKIKKLQKENVILTYHLERIICVCCQHSMSFPTEPSFTDGFNIWVQSITACNQYIDAMEPWTFKITDPTRMSVVLGTIFKCIRHLAIAIQPIIPTSAGKLLDQLGIPEDERTFAHLADDTWYDRLRASGHRIAPPTPIFPRLEMPVDED